MKAIFAFAVLLVSTQVFARPGYGPGFGQGPGIAHGPGLGQGPGFGHGPGFGQGPGWGHPGYGEVGRLGGWDNDDGFTRSCQIETHRHERFISGACRTRSGNWDRVWRFDSQGCVRGTIDNIDGRLQCRRAPVAGGGGGFGQGPGWGHPGYGEVGRLGGWDNDDGFTRSCQIETHRHERFISGACRTRSGNWDRVWRFDSQGCVRGTIDNIDGRLQCRRAPVAGGVGGHLPPQQGYYDVRAVSCHSSVIGQTNQCRVVARHDRYIESVTPVRITVANGAMCQQGVSYGITHDRRSIWVLPRCSGEFRIVVRGAW